MKDALRRRYGHGAARIALAGSAPRWTTGGSLGHALRPLATAGVGLVLVLLAVPWLMPQPEVDPYEPLELALEVVEPPVEPSTATPAAAPRATSPPPPVFNRLPVQPELPRLAELEPRPLAPALPRARVQSPEARPTLAPAKPRGALRIASAPSRSLAPVSAPPSPRVSVPALPEPRAPKPVIAASPASDLAREANPEDVPLGRLAACPQPGEEDGLKQRVIASPNATGACTSAAGTYRFVENRNLNAFLLLVRRSPDRPLANRCEELRFALDCLEARPKEPNES